mmetsp:Transcript_6483/g.12169  ORF Transcript_6483/g.12169 Transcript_6483/m.12169 type:complete len:570 (+) Transcript_6483:372-2081(+)|eukprot:CAMPEP_0114301662 /NCGR_PEP_ID=MMETSP0059-20121206/14235_1 /TAXON_ID=36894 /ORGANISM="Pyramimonas parkeae, Strain CCMP726" /LENGTH=569 /DNA_ID=CAMNT_0001424433 /DNA_START=525 /DNA_END=2234 /DNA_ORIENTATION=-
MHPKTQGKSHHRAHLQQPGMTSWTVEGTQERTNRSSHPNKAPIDHISKRQRATPTFAVPASQESIIPEGNQGSVSASVSHTTKEHEDRNTTWECKRAPPSRTGKLPTAGDLLQAAIFSTDAPIVTYYNYDRVWNTPTWGKLEDRRTLLPPYYQRWMAKYHFNNSRCAVVGNSGSLLLRNFGRSIDSHDIVVRLNQAPTQRYAKHLGTKATFRVINKSWHSKYANAKPIKFNGPPASKIPPSTQLHSKHTVVDQPLLNHQLVLAPRQIFRALQQTSSRDAEMHVSNKMPENIQAMRSFTGAKSLQEVRSSVPTTSKYLPSGAKEDQHKPYASSVLNALSVVNPRALQGPSTSSRSPEAAQLVSTDASSIRTTENTEKQDNLHVVTTNQALGIPDVPYVLLGHTPLPLETNITLLLRLDRNSRSQSLRDDMNTISAMRPDVSQVLLTRSTIQKSSNIVSKYRSRLRCAGYGPFEGGAATTSGFAAVVLMARLCNQVSVYGFGGVSSSIRLGGKTVPYQYYKLGGTERIMGASVHSFEVERRLLQSLSFEGHLQVCNELSQDDCGLRTATES